MTSPAIHLPDRAWFDAIAPGGIGVHVVEGDHCTRQHSAGPTTVHRHSHPPKQWVAPSEQKCETCAPGASCDWGECDRPSVAFRLAYHDQVKSHWVWLPVCDRHSHLWSVSTRPGCPDCLGSGRPLVEVTVPCPHIACVDDPYRWDCPICGNAQRLSIGKGTVEAVVPIVNGPFASSWPAQNVIAVNRDAAHYYQLDRMVGEHRRWHKATPVNLDPNPEQHIGKYGVIWKRVA